MNSGKFLTLLNLVKRVKNQSSAFAKVVEAFTGETQNENLINHVLITQKSGGKVFRDLSPNSHLVEIKCLKKRRKYIFGTSSSMPCFFFFLMLTAT